MARGESPVLRRSIHETSLLRSSPGRNGSPSRSHLAEIDLHKDMAKLSLFGLEQQKVYNAQKTAFQEELDAREEALAVSQLSQIEQAMASHEVVRERAQAVLQAHLKAEREQELRRVAESKQREEEERRRKEESERRAKAEQERRVREQTEQEEAAKRAEAEQIRLEEERRKKAAAEADRRQKDKQEQDRQTAEAQAQADAQAAKQRDDEAARKAAAAVPEPTRPSSTAQPASTPAQSSSSNIEQEHQAYLSIHKRLKKFRRYFWEEFCRTDKAYRAQVGEMRRGVRTAVGQLRVDGTEHNKVAMTKVWTIIGTAIKDSFSPRVAVNEYLPPHHALPDNTISIPSLAIYLLSILAKRLITDFIILCPNNPKAAEAPGVLAAQIFAHPDLSFSRPSSPSRVSLISILLSKYHASAPPLFGISGSEATQKSRLGWRTMPDPATDQKAYVSEQVQYDRLVGLAAGYAAISLRNFSKAKNHNALPPRHFWASLAHLVNTPPAQIQVTHVILLKSLLENSVERVVQFWGAAGVAALRQAVVVLPDNLPAAMRSHSTVKALGIMRERWASELKFHLT